MTLLHRRSGNLSLIILLFLPKSCHQFKVSHKALFSSTHSLCEACQLDKVHRQHFSTIEIKTTQLLELIHIVLWGPSSIVSKNGYKYYISFISDYNIYTWICPLKIKSEAFEVFKLFKL